MRTILSFLLCIGLFSGCASVSNKAVESESVTSLIAKLDSDNAYVRMGAIKAIGVMGESAVDAVPALIKLLSNNDANVRANAAFALGQIGPKASESVPALINCLLDNDSKVQKNSVEALANIGGANIPALLIPILSSNNLESKKLAMDLLSNFDSLPKNLITPLISIVKGDSALRDLAFNTLVKIGPDSIGAITALLLSGDKDIISKATEALKLLKK